LGYDKIAICDKNTLAGVVRAHAEARKQGIKIIPAARLDLADGPSVIAYPTNKEGYSQLSGLLTLGNLRAEKGDCILFRKDIFENPKNIIWALIPPQTLDKDFQIEKLFSNDLQQYHEALGHDLFLILNRSYQGIDNKRLFRLNELAFSSGIRTLATNDVYYHHPERRELQDILTCIREKTTIDRAGFLLHANRERYLKPIAEMERLFRAYPKALFHSREISEACCFTLDSLRYEYPEEITTEGRSAQEELTLLAWNGARNRFGVTVPQKVVDAINHELHFIKKMDYAPYFLTVYDIVRFANEQGILCQGRGSAANSTVCYCLGITAVNPGKFDLLFERFISDARNEPPDIDVDFEHERREEVIQYIYRKYGRDRAGIVATVTQQHLKGSIRDVGKAMGLSIDAVNRLSGSVWHYTPDGFQDQTMSAEGFDTSDPHFRKVLELTHQYMGFPRQLGQHTGGFVITRGKLSDLCPVLNARMVDRTCIEWNKDDIDTLGFLKIDVLALGMLTCIRKAFDLLRKHYGVSHDLASIPEDDPAVYEMICHADTIGVFQIESRAQQSMLPRLKPTCFYDLVIEVAIVRPGPIQGDMVHPYLRRRNNEEPVDYPSPALKEILGRTLGVPLFQEQAMKIAIVAAGFSPAEADELRRSMATFKVHGMVQKFEKKLVDGMLARGYTEEYARRVFKQLEGFGSYGFPESHAASFALLVYISSWLKCYYPDVFAAALLNSMPMGFYQPAQIIQDARRHQVEVREADINHSFWDNTLEETEGRYKALRLGFRQISGLRQAEIELLIKSRESGFLTINDLRDMGLSQSTLEKLADADCFRSLEIDRRRALWILSNRDHAEALFKGISTETAYELNTSLPKMELSEHVVQDYASFSLSVKAHPVQFVREKLNRLQVVPTGKLPAMKDGDRIKVAGLVLVRQRPGTAKGVCFMTIEDETGFANLVVFQNIFEKFRPAVLQSRLVLVEGKLQIEGEVIHVIVEHCSNITGLLSALHEAPSGVIEHSQQLEMGFPQEPTAEKPKHNLNRVFDKGRNFH